MNEIPSSPKEKRITKIMCSMPILILPPARHGGGRDWISSPCDRSVGTAPSYSRIPSNRAFDSERADTKSSVSSCLFENSKRVF